MFKGEHAAEFPEGIVANEDVVFRFLALCKCKKKIDIDKPIFLYRNNLHSVTHDKNFLNRLEHTILAWEWAKEKCGDRYRDRCDRQIFCLSVMWLNHACERGVSVEQITDVLQKHDIQSLLKNRQALWSGNVECYEKFFANPYRYRMKARLTSIPRRVAKRLVYIPCIRKLYYKIKFRQDISFLVNHSE